MFWVEMEQLLLNKAADFKGKQESIVEIVLAFKHRSNETFWKVFGTLLNQVSEDLGSEKLIEVLDILDATNG